jgi:energy-coupling factor transport system substrate-specific component
VRKILLRKFTVRDIVFLAVLAAALTVTGVITMPLVMTITLFGVRNAAAAIFYGAFGAIALLKVRKPGALLLVSIFNGAILLMMSPVMFLNNFFGALAAEIIALAIFKTYENEKAIVLAAGLFVPLTLPASVFFAMLLNGQTVSQIVERPWLSALICALTVGLSFAGAAIGLKIGRELRKAGKLK